jgi:hypothetical protein
MRSETRITSKVGVLQCEFFDDRLLRDTDQAALEPPSTD